MKKITFRTLNSNYLMLVFLALLTSINAFGASISWTGSAGDGLWATALNWSGGEVPVAGDHVVIPAGAVVTVNSDLSSTKLNSISVLGTLT
ncbi:MAG: G8 domain-containing protein, partial [Paludibacter sp.]